MSFSDPVGDLLTRIRNAQKARLSSVQIGAPACVAMCSMCSKNGMAEFKSS